jgi:hypothetical protein
MNAATSNAPVVQPAPAMNVKQAPATNAPAANTAAPAANAGAAGAPNNTRIVVNSAANSAPGKP